MPKRLTPLGEAAPPVEPIVTGATLPPRPAAKKRATKRTPPKATESQAKYVYNLRAIECRFTLTSGRRIELQPRGQRGDLDIVNADEQEDPIFLANAGLLFEVIEPGLARKIIANQQVNAKSQEHPIWSHLRNEKGEAYEQREAHVEEAFERQGVVVGEVKTPAADGSSSSQSITYTRAAGPRYVDAPGSPGHPATEYMQSVPGNISPEDYHEFLLWKQFMAQKAAILPEGEEIRDSLNVTVEPTQTEDDARQDA